MYRQARKLKKYRKVLFNKNKYKIKNFLQMKFQFKIFYSLSDKVMIFQQYT